MRPDILIVIIATYEHTRETVEKFTIYTNARTDNDALDELLEAWILGCSWKKMHVDESKAVPNTNRITIGYRIADDAFATESDACEALTIGIIASINGLVRRPGIEIKPLSEMPS